MAIQKSELRKSAIIMALHRLGLVNYYKVNVGSGCSRVVDKELERLIAAGLLADTDERTYGKGELQWMKNKIVIEYWEDFLNLCDDTDEIVSYILSFPQTHYWNGWLYAACERRVGLNANR